MPTAVVQTACDLLCRPAKDCSLGSVRTWSRTKPHTGASAGALCWLRTTPQSATSCAKELGARCGARAPGRKRPCHIAMCCAGVTKALGSCKQTAGSIRPCHIAMCCAGVTTPSPKTTLCLHDSAFPTLPSASPPLPSSIAPWEGLSAVGAAVGRWGSLTAGPCVTPEPWGGTG